MVGMSVLESTQIIHYSDNPAASRAPVGLPSQTAPDHLLCIRQ